MLGSREGDLCQADFAGVNKGGFDDFVGQFGDPDCPGFVATDIQVSYLSEATTRQKYDAFVTTGQGTRRSTQHVAGLGDEMIYAMNRDGALIWMRSGSLVLEIGVTARDGGDARPAIQWLCIVTHENTVAARSDLTNCRKSPDVFFSRSTASACASVGN